MFNSLRHTMIIVICGAIFFAFTAFLGILRQVLFVDFKNNVEKTDRKFAQILSQNVNFDIGRAFEIGKLAAEYPALLNFSKSTQKSLLKNMQKREPNFEYIAIIDTKNNRPQIVTTENFSDADKTVYEWFKVFPPNYQADISPVYFSEKTKNLVVTFVEGIEENGEVKAALMGDINLTKLQDMIQEFNRAHNCQAYLIDRNGTAIAQPNSFGRVFNYRTMTYSIVAQDEAGNVSYNDQGHLILRRASFSSTKGLNDSIFAAMKGESGFTEYDDGKGNKYFCCYQPIELSMVQTNWALVIVHPTIEMLAALDKVMNRAFISGIFLVILVAIALNFFTRKITDPILAMTEMAEKIRAGDFSGQLDINSTNELGNLANNLNNMIQGLRTHREQSKAAEIKFKEIAFHDALTGLPNRNNFLTNLRQKISDSVEGNFQGAMMFVDVDKFKSVNDTFGHATGDGVLIEFGRRLVEIVGNKNYVCRYGGDEFLVFLPDYNAQNTFFIADALVRKMCEIFIVSEKEIKVSSSIGIAFFPKDAKNIDELLEKADAALYVSKRSGRDQFNFYQDGMISEIKKS